MKVERLLWVVGVVALGMTSTGCGVLGWALTPRAEVHSYTVPRTEEVEIRSFPPGAMVVVDGAEAGPTPRTVNVPVTEVRHERQQSIIPGLVGMLLDGLLFGTATAVCISENAPECTVIAGGGGLALFLTGAYLNFGRSRSNEASDVLPAAFDIGVRHPNHPPQTRRIRVPDLTEVDFLLTPTTPAPPPTPDAPVRAPEAPNAGDRR